MSSGSATRERWRELVLAGALCCPTTGCADDVVLGEHVVTIASAGPSWTDYTSSSETQETVVGSETDVDSTSESPFETTRDKTHFFDPHPNEPPFFEGRDGGRHPRPPRHPEAGPLHPEGPGSFPFEPQNVPPDTP